jgi:methylated-DNA-[protein]-cysteine S-methyltransferase
MKKIPNLFLQCTWKSEKITELSLSLHSKSNTENPELTREIEEAWLNNKNPLPKSLDVTSMKPFQKKVLQTLRNTKPGELLTYSELAKRAGYPKAARAVGRALATNPYLLLFPCHRVIRQDGSLGNFSAGENSEEGIAIKKILIAFEKTVVN